MNYIGSKYSLLDFIYSSIEKTLAAHGDEREPSKLKFAELLAGTGVVSAFFKDKGFSVAANDIQYYSYVILKHILENNDLDEERTNNLIEELNSLDGIEGFIYKNYSFTGSKDEEFQRMYFSDENAKKCDAIRTAIEEKHVKGEITDGEYYFLLASLINSIDKYANTASVYGAFLKTLKRSAQKEMVLTPYPLVKGTAEYHAYNKDISELITEISGDILYLDPPYNARQYCTNYHLLETIARYDEPTIKGKTGLREYSAQKSAFCEKAKVEKVFTDILKTANFKYIFLSYNNEGLMSFESIEKIMRKFGKYKVYIKEHRRFKADSARDAKADSTVEYLHCLVKK